MPNRGILGSAITSHDCSEQSPVTQLTRIAVWWVAKKQVFIPWTKGKYRLTSPGQKFSTHLQPTDLFFLSPGKKKELWRGPPTKYCLCLEVPGTNAHAESRKGGHCLQLQPYIISWIQITASNSTASACCCSSADGVAAKLSLQDWEMDFLFFKQDHVQMNWGSPTDRRNKIYYWAIF